VAAGEGDPFASGIGEHGPQPLRARGTGADAAPAKQFTDLGCSEGPPQPRSQAGARGCPRRARVAGRRYCHHRMTRNFACGDLHRTRVTGRHGGGKVTLRPAYLGRRPTPSPSIMTSVRACAEGATVGEFSNTPIVSRGPRIRPGTRAGSIRGADWARSRSWIRRGQAKNGFNKPKIDCRTSKRPSVHGPPARAAKTYYPPRLRFTLGRVE